MDALPKTSSAARPISMVFGQISPPQDSIYIKTMLSKLAALREQKRHHQPTQASKVLSMVSSFRKNQLLGIHHNRKTKPCLANMLPEAHKGAARAPRRAADPLSMVFIPASHKPPGKTSHINQTPCLEPLKPHDSRNQH